MKLAELRKKHPGIKATSVKKFLEKLEKEKNIVYVDKAGTYQNKQKKPMTLIPPKETIIQAEEVFEESKPSKELKFKAGEVGYTHTITATLKKSEGLGDTIEKITKATGIKKVVEWIAGKDCGCSERKNKLNELYRYKVECMVESEYIWWGEFLKRQSPNRVEKEDVFEISRLFTRLFKQKAGICVNCPSGAKRILEIIEHINKVYESYKTN